MIVYVLVGGMKGTTWVQIIKAVLLIVGAGVMTVWVLAKYGFNLSALLGAAVDNSPAAGEKLLSPGLQYGKSTAPPSSTSSRSALALVLGTAGLPHVLMRFYTVPPRARRPGAVVELGDLADRHLLPVHARARLRRRARSSARTRSRPHRARRTRRHRCWPSSSAASSCSGLISAVAFATILAVVAGLTITASASFAHDVYAPGDQAGQGQRRRRGEGRADHRGGHRSRRDHRRHLRQRPEHRLPGGPGVRGRGEREPADDPVLAVLAAVQHPRRAVEHLRRADLVDHR